MDKVTGVRKIQFEANKASKAGGVPAYGGRLLVEAPSQERLHLALMLLRNFIDMRWKFMHTRIG